MPITQVRKPSILLKRFLLKIFRKMFGGMKLNTYLCIVVSKGTFHVAILPDIHKLF